MSLFGTSPPDDGSPFTEDPSAGPPRTSLFDDDDDDNDFGSGRTGGSPWTMPTARRKPLSRADVLRTLLAGVDVPDSYTEAFDRAVAEDGEAGGGTVAPSGVAKTLAAARLGADDQARIMGLLAPAGSEPAAPVGRDEFHVLLALVGLAQEGETVSLDGVDERRRSK